MAPRRELMKVSIDSLLLCLISQQPMYGYQINKELERKSQGYYYITDKGLQGLIAKRDQWQDFFTAMNLIIQPVRI